ncbi:hypothetical protein SAMN04488122_2810 [Chitinophaga arvensicola]|uniref:Uncharacterized protein n=2 Tax=Chitinophaga arvensicola TaxID=29529 RepID=A0A1I0RH91_9BACT|nr:hypothetical protein SAMN04488122_2810 [Chitinophaga arvensicola]
MGIAKGPASAVMSMITSEQLDVDAFMDDQSYTPVVMSILTSYGLNEGEDRLLLLRFVLEKGANPNTNCKSGYNSLHVAVQQEKLVREMELLMDFGGDPNLADRNGGTVAYWAIQAFPWRTEGEERQQHLRVLEKIMMAGADLDRKNKFGVTPRAWLERSPEDVKVLVAKCEALEPVYTPSLVLQPVFPTRLTYPEVAKQIWQQMVPPMGQADTVQGELLRALEKLRDEAQRNGNINYFDSHLQLAKFVMDTLINTGGFDKKTQTKIKSSAKQLMKAGSPYLEDDVYDYLVDKVCEFYLKHSTPIPHIHNPNILC